MTNRVVIVLGGRRAEVDADQVKILLKKEELVAQSLDLQKFIKADPIGNAYARKLLSEKVSKIINLNRRIRRTVRILAI